MFVDKLCDERIEENYQGAGNKKRTDCPSQIGSECIIPKIDADDHVVFKCYDLGIGNGLVNWTLLGKYQIIRMYLA